MVKKPWIFQRERPCERPINWSDDRDIVMDDESYFTETGAGMLGNTGFYTKDRDNCPDEVKYRFDEKFPKKVMVWVAISKERLRSLDK